MDDVLTLIAPTLAQNDIGAFVEQSEKSREIFGTVSSVSRAEWYNAGREGMNPEIVFTTPLVNYCWEPEAEFHADSSDDLGNDSDDHSGDDSDDEGQLVSHLYPFMCQIDPKVSLVTPASPFLE